MYIVVRFYLINSSNSVLNEMCVVQHKCVAAVRWFNWTDDRWQTGRSLSLNSIVMSAVCRVSDQWIFITFVIIIIIFIRYSDPVTKTFRFLMSSRIQPCLHNMSQSDDFRFQPCFSDSCWINSNCWILLVSASASDPTDFQWQILANSSLNFIQVLWFAVDLW